MNGGVIIGGPAACPGRPSFTKQIPLLKGVRTPGEAFAMAGGIGPFGGTPAGTKPGIGYCPGTGYGVVLAAC